MELTRLAGILIIVGFVVFWIGNLYSPPDVYSESDLNARLQIVNEYQNRWAVSQGLGGFGLGITVVGLILMSIHYANGSSPWLTYLPSAFNILAVVLFSIWLYQYITDPVSIWELPSQSPLIVGATILMLAGAILYGFLFLQVGFPGWLSYLAIGYSAIAIIALIVTRPPVFYTISLYYFILLAVAVVLIRR
jgi:hypothetical protein